MNTGLLGFPRALAEEFKNWLVPSGAGMDFWGPESAIPKGYVMPVGQVRRAADFPRLAGRIFPVAADGTITFPDKRGRVSAARDNMGGTAANRLTTGGSGIDGTLIGAAGGADTVALTSAQNGLHNHAVTDPGHGHGISDPGHGHSYQRSGGKGGGVPGFNQSPPVAATETANINASGTGISVSSAGTGISIQNAGTGAAHQNTQPTIVCNYIIKT